MQMMLLGLVVILVLVALFTLSNANPVTIMFLQFTLFRGQLALAVVGAGVLGALLAYLPSLIRQGHLTSRIRELEMALSALEAAPAQEVAPAQDASLEVLPESAESPDESGSVDGTRTS